MIFVKFTKSSLGNKTMNSQQNVFDDIFNRTKSESMTWTIVGNTYANQFIFQPAFIFRIFRSIFLKDNSTYEVLIVEKKFPDPDWDMNLEKYRSELMFISNGVLVATLDDYSIKNLPSLINLIENNSTQSKELFGQADGAFNS